MKTLQTMRGRLAQIVLFNTLLFGLILIEGRTGEIRVLRNSPALQISNYFTAETLTPAVSGWTLCACIQRGSRQA
jgi:hypothetical protein